LGGTLKQPVGLRAAQIWVREAREWSEAEWPSRPNPEGASAPDAVTVLLRAGLPFYLHCLFKWFLCSIGKFLKQILFFSFSDIVRWF